LGGGRVDNCEQEVAVHNGAALVKVHFDDQIFSSQMRGGVSRYFIELMKAYRSDTSLGVEVTTPRFWTQNELLLETGRARQLPTRLGREGVVIRQANRFRQRSRSARVIHHTYYHRRYLGLSDKGRTRVVTVYDMIPEVFPDMYPGGNPHKDKRLFVEAADLVFCISEATKRDVIRFYGEPSAPIVVTPLAAGNRFHADAAKPPILPESYVLFVGKRADYKDFEVLAKAFAVAGLPRDTRLVAVGGGPWDDDERTLLASLGLADRAVQVDLDDQGLAGAYAHALCFVFPSRYEGFGLPTLEAMASGCPTILANASSHPEVGGDVALYFAPGDDAELAKLLGEVVGDDELRARLSAEGLRRAAGFSWHETARLTANAYRKAAA
jgi:glycosyltransferase involved in cell wall biosynthesis